MGNGDKEKQTCPICQKSFKRLKAHISLAHPEAKRPPPEASQPNLLEKLKAIGVDPADVTAIIEKSVVDTLEKMQLGEAITKRMDDIETRLAQQITSLAQRKSETVTEPPQDTTLRDNVLAILAKKLIGGDSTSLESLTATMKLAQGISEIMIKPYLDGQAAARREMNELIRFVSGVQKLPPGAKEGVIGGAGESGD